MIEHMKSLRASGMSFDAIAVTLNSNGISTRTPWKKMAWLLANSLWHPFDRIPFMYCSLALPHRWTEGLTC